jgi:signal transduction histidine kinase
VRREAETALDQADRLSTTIEELLALARSHASAGRREVDVAVLVTSRVASWQPNARRAHRRIDVAVDRDWRCTAAASAPALAQAIDALLENALRHGAGTVQVGVCRRDHHVEVTVGDEGACIPPGAVNSVFERHVSLRGGTGVGLALARSLVEASGGRLELVRAEPACFRIMLPAPS